MSKPKLLITMGCSYTEGEGSYDYSSIPESIKLDTDFPNKHGQLWDDFRTKNRQRWHEKGWPNRLGKKLNYDRVINLGLSGSSTSGQLKVFMEKYGDEDFKDYDVLLIWLLIDPSRFSFYSNMRVVNHHSGNLDEITEEYVKNIEDIVIDPLLEQMFYVKVMSKICKLNKWTFYFGHLESYVQQYIPKFNMQDHFIPGTQGSFTDKSCLSPICNHPNEDGYEIMATELFNYFKKTHPNLINQTSSEIDMEWEWDGLPLDWKSKFMI